MNDLDKQIEREGRDWFTVALGTAIYVALVIGACWIVP